MNALSTPLALLVGLVAALLLGWSALEASAREQPRLTCAPAAKPSVPPEYLFYHALVSPHAALSDKQIVHASCPPSKLVRT
ncbi:MAG: hypothetical protein HGA21_11080 [Burkholderiaceae bacterium]|jgi:hypothetical protein|nr:hypothetical protein [Burkholderiaceae bacterium]